jgi:DNA sulfur modification protein DndE
MTKISAFAITVFTIMGTGQCFADDNSDLKKNATLTTEEAREIGIEAVVYGYPMVICDVTKRVQTNVTEPQNNGHAPVNQFSNFLRYPNAAYHDVVRINVDTLYSFAWLDLSKEPMILSVPDTHGRYYLMPILDAWTNVFASPGKRTTGTKAGNLAIVGPNWKGTLPDGIAELRSPTNMAIIAGRTQANGPEDYTVVNAIQRQYKLTPLSAWGKPYTPPKGSVDPMIDAKTPPVDQVNRMTAAVFFKTLAKLMKENPPSPADAPIVARLAKIGIVPGQDFDMTKLDPVVAAGLEQSVQTAVAKVQAAAPKVGTMMNGWNIPPMNTANFGTDYQSRAIIALIGLGANIVKDAVYPTAFVDADSTPLNGANRYVLHFDKGELPPANAFWSVTMYDAQSFLVANPINRYNIAGWMPLKQNPDGSLDVYIQRDSPGKDKKSNWLPAAQGAFNVTMRIYWPKESVLDGTWKPPAIQMVRGLRSTSGDSQRADPR